MKRAMEIILLERVPNLGQMGDVVAVRPGYARNFLLPQRKALRATEPNKAYFEARRKEIEAQNLERKKEAESAAAKMNGAGIVLVRQAGEAGQLYGSVSARDIARSLSESGYQVTRGQVELDRPIKSLGVYNVEVRLHPEVSVFVKVNVARSEGEAEQQWETGTAAVGAAEAGEAGEAGEAAAEAEELDTDQLVAELLEEEERAQEAVAEAREAIEEHSEAEEAGESGDDESGAGEDATSSS